MTMATLPPIATTALVPGVVPGAVRRALLEAPIGQQSLVEAALAWQRLRPPVEASAPNGYLPIVQTADEEVATRVARLLSPLTFSVIDHTDGAGETRWQVDLPMLRHRPVSRTLATVWRHTVRRFGPDARMSGADRETAIALWRMALLLAEPQPNRVLFRPGGPAPGGLLVMAAARLGVHAELRRLARRPAVVVEEPTQIRLLLATVLRGVSPVGAYR